VTSERSIREDENAFLESHSWDEYGEWYLGLSDDATDETKSRYGFGYGDFRRLHRSGLIACQYRADRADPQGDRARSPRPPAASR
jgi:hypothetical protein